MELTQCLCLSCLAHMCVPQICWVCYVSVSPLRTSTGNISFLLLAQARHILSSVPELTVAQDTSAGVSEEVNFLTLENKSLQNHLADQQQQHAQKMSEVMSELHEARQEMVS